jgi:hypothetical protein
MLAVKGNQVFLLDDIKEAFVHNRPQSEDEQTELEQGCVWRSEAAG